MTRKIKAGILGGLTLGLFFINNAYASETYYELTDYFTVDKIDAHVHVNNHNDTFIALAIKNNFRLVTINVDYPDFPAIDEQLSTSAQLRGEHPKVVAYASTFSMNGWEDKAWSQSVIHRIDESLINGAVAVKVWKNIGMDFKGEDNQLVMLDDPKLMPIFNYLSERGVPLIGHQGEPKNCWLPVTEMTVNNDKQYFTEHPQYHMSLHPEFPSYEDHMAVRDKVLSDNPKLTFIGAHFASIEWSVDELAQFLEQFPLAVVDMAARMGQIQFQSQRDYKKVRDFFIKYQDRLLYATDLTHQPYKAEDINADKQFIDGVNARWRSDWQYLSSANEMAVGEINGKFKGLQLPKTVINKIYSENALKTFNKAFK